MAAKCLAQIHLCRLRVTRLNSDGTPHASANNEYVTDNPMVLTVNPDVEAGQDRVLIGGCDCIVARWRGFDKLKGFTLELDMGEIEPGLFEMLTGATIIDDLTDPIGLSFPTQAFDCSSAVQPNVAVEAWATGVEEDQQSTTWPYVRWIFPSSFWQWGQQTLQNDFAQPKFTAFTRGNTNWGEGIYGDQPASIGQLGGFFYDDTIPAASCGYQTHSIT